MERRIHTATIVSKTNPVVDAEGRTTWTSRQQRVSVSVGQLNPTEKANAAQRGIIADQVMLVDAGVSVPHDADVTVAGAPGVLGGRFRVTSVHQTVLHQRVLLRKADPT